MSTDQPHDFQPLDVVETLDKKLDELRAELRGDTFEFLDSNPTDGEIETAVTAAMHHRWRERRSKETGQRILGMEESKLFEVINDSWKPEKKTRWDDLVFKRERDILPNTELQELVALGEELEALNTRRLNAVAELAKIRGTDFQKLCLQLEIISG